MGAPCEIVDLSGHTVFVTDAAGPLGRHTAYRFAARGARVLLAGPQRHRLDATAAAITMRVAGARLEAVPLDLADLASVYEVGHRYRDEVIDVLLNNAEVTAPPRRQVTADGFEMTFGVNYLGHYALTGLLLPCLSRAPDPRVINVAALAAAWPRARLNDVMSLRGYRPKTAYAKSQRANVVFTEELASRWVRNPITPLAVHLTASSHRRGPESVSASLLYAATSRMVRPGAFLGPPHPASPVSSPLPPGTAEPRLGASLFHVSTRFTGVTFGRTLRSGLTGARVRR